MPRTCTVCRHEDRDEIDRALMGGEPYRGIAGRHGLSPSNVDRHRAHIPKALVLAAGVREQAAAESLGAKMARLEGDARRLQARAEADQDVRAALAALKLQSELLGILRSVASETFAPPVLTDEEVARELGRLLLGVQA